MSESVSISPWASFGALLRWNLSQSGPMLPLIVVVQAMLAAGIVVGFGLVIPNIDPATAQFLATGAPTILLLTLGLVIVPQGVSRGRTDGSFNYFRSLPVPRALILLADLTLWLVIALPSLAVAVAVGALRFQIEFTFNWPLLVLGLILVTVMATSVGYAIAVSFPAMVAQSLTQVLIFFVMLFSPVAFPASQLPQWYQGLHQFLPVVPGADLIRAGLVADTYSVTGTDLLVLAVWTVIGLAISIRALTRRA